MNVILRLPFLPPSANEAYRRNQWGGMTLSAKAKVFITAAKLQINRQLDGTVLFDPNRAHSIHLHFRSPTLLNKGWETGKAATRFKKFDVANLEKLLSDLVCEVFGIDDSCIVRNTQSKSLGKAGTIIVLTELPDSAFLEDDSDEG